MVGDGDKVLGCVMSEADTYLIEHVVHHHESISLFLATADEKNGRYSPQESADEKQQHQQGQQQETHHVKH
ncbi:hypothetical protein E2C01_023872 [Portunus trituberculatus]|uniref:Uncharacterized protein n=1 Tax=Portunus trituberculatus TaxID=210409 RepID=A0A5B7EBP9_PORTR|nr:hypothetical protein [Portunus trituberculatus]